MSGTEERRKEQDLMMNEAPGAQGTSDRSMTHGTQGTQGTQGKQGMQGNTGIQGQKTQEWSQFRDIFQKHKIIPDIVNEEPQHLLEVKFNDVSYSPGDDIRLNDLKEQPKLKWVCEDNKYYLLMMLECGLAEKQEYERKYWCVLNIQGDNIDQGFECLKYQSPSLSNDNEGGRLVFLVFEQQDKEDCSQNEKPKAGINVDVKEIIQKKKLGTLVASNFFILRR